MKVYKTILIMMVFGVMYLVISPPHALASSTACEKKMFTDQNGKIIKNGYIGRLPLKIYVTSDSECGWPFFEGQGGSVDIMDATTGKTLMSDWRHKNTRDGIIKYISGNNTDIYNSVKRKFGTTINALMFPKNKNLIKAKLVFHQENSCGDTPDCPKQNDIIVPIQIRK